MNRKKIVFVNTRDHDSNPQGAERYLERLMSELYSLGYECIVISSAHVREQNGSTRRHKLGKTWLSVEGGGIEDWKNLLKPLKADLLHLLNPSAIGLNVVRAAKTLNIPVVCTVVDSWWLCPKATLLRYDMTICDGVQSASECKRCIVSSFFESALLRRSYSAVFDLRAIMLGEFDIARQWENRSATVEKTLGEVDELIMLSRAMERKVLQYLGVSPPRTQFIPIPPVSESKSKYRLKYKSGAGSVLTVGYAGKIASYKGFFTLLRALDHVAENHFVKLLVAGSFADPESRKMFDKMNLAYPVERLGWVDGDAMDQFYKRLDIMVVPSLCWENQPQVMLESKAFGVPAFTSTVPGLEELNDDVRLRFAPGDDNQLARRIECWLAAPHTPKLLNKSNDWAGVAQCTSDIYQRLA